MRNFLEIVLKIELAEIDAGIRVFDTRVRKMQESDSRRVFLMGA